jgi:two-component system cell cycle sensor histidine kinase/response regulator CckA
MKAPDRGTDPPADAPGASAGPQEAPPRDERLASALVGAGLSLWELDVETLRFSYDLHYQAMLGFAVGEAPGSLGGWELSIHPDDRAEAKRRLSHLLSGGAPSYESRHRIRTKDGGWRWVAERGEVVSRRPDGGALRAVGWLRDDSERHRLEEELAHSQKLEAVGRLAGGAAHDLNNLLTSILSAAEFASEGLPPGAPAREDLAVIREAAERASQLTRQLLAFGRRQVAAPRVVSVNAVLLETERMLRRLLSGDIEIATAVAVDAWPARVDPGQLQQFLVNLALNSRTGVDRGGRLTFSTRNVRDSGEGSAGMPPGDWVLLAVSDTGRGMAREAFEGSSPQGGGRDRGGIGLGAACRALKQNGAQIAIAREVGRGTRVELLLPRAAPPPADARRQGPVRGGRETIVLVEDESLVLEVNARALTALGYTVLACRSGAEALERASAQSGHIDILVADVVMPRMSGPALARALGAIRPGVKILFVSGYSLDLASGHPGAAFLGKPFTPSELAARVREVLDAGSAAALDRRAE